MWRRTYSRTYSVSPHPHIFLPLLVMPLALDRLFRGVVFASVLVAVPSPCMRELALSVSGVHLYALSTCYDQDCLYFLSAALALPSW